MIDSKGTIWVALLRVGMVAKIDPQTMAVTRFKEGADTSRSRRLDVLADGTIWFGDEARGMLGRLNPATGEVKEWPVPGGPEASPYALTKDDQDRIWFSETGKAKRLVGFDPKTEKFFANIEVSGTIRHMHFDHEDADDVVRHRREHRRAHRAAEGEVSTTLAAAVLATTVRLVASHAYAEGAPPGFSGGFKEESCHACHFHAELNSGGGRVTIEGVPATFARRRALHADRHADPQPA